MSRKSDSLPPGRHWDDLKGTPDVSVGRHRSGDFLWALVGRGGAAGLQALTLVLLARFSTPADFGLTMGTQSVLLTFTYLLGFGLGSYITIEQAKNRYSPVVSDIAYVNQRTSLVAGGACFIGLVVAAILNPSFLVFLPLAIAMLALRNSAVLEGLTLANGRVRIFGASLFFRRFLQAAVFILLCLLGISPLAAYSFAYALSEVAINLALRRLVGYVPIPVTKPSFIGVLRRSMPYWIETVAVQFRGLDVSFAGLMGGPAIGGIYAVPARLSSAILMVPSTFANLSLPRIASGTPRSFVKICLAAIPLILVIFMVLAGLGVFADSLIRFALGDEYISAVVPIRIFCVGFAVLTCTTIANALAQGVGLAHHVAWTSTVGALLSVSLVGAGAAMNGAEGASWGFSCAMIVQFFLLCGASARGVLKYLKSS